VYESFSITEINYEFTLLSSTVSEVFTFI